MSLLTTFALMFETDAKKAADDVGALDDSLSGVSDTAGDVLNSFSEAEIATADLIASMQELGLSNAEVVESLVNLGGEYDESVEAVENFNKEMKEQRDQEDNTTHATNTLAKSILTLGAAYLSFGAIADGIFGNADAIDHMGKFTQTLGENVVEMDAWGAAAERNGGSLSGMMGSVSSLNSALGQIKVNGGGDMIKTLSRLGVRAHDEAGKLKSAFDILAELADPFKKMDAKTASAFGKQLGLDQGTILLLQQSRGEVGKLVERQKLLGGVTKEGYEQAAKFNDAWDDTKRVFNSLWMTTNSSILPALTSVLGLLEKLVFWVKANSTLVEGFFIGVAGAITAAYLPAITAAAAATIVAVAPFVAIGAAIAAVGIAFAIMYEDFVAWSNGGSSFLGDMLGSFEDFKKGFDDIIDSIAKKWESFIGVFKDGFDYISSIDLNPFGDDEEVNVNMNKITSNTLVAMKTIDGYSANPINNGGSAVTSNNSTYNVSVAGATIDARGMSKAEVQDTFGDSLANSTRMAIGQLDNGVDR